MADILCIVVSELNCLCRDSRFLLAEGVLELIKLAEFKEFTLEEQPALSLRECVYHV